MKDIEKLNYNKELKDLIKSHNYTKSLCGFSFEPICLTFPIQALINKNA